MNVALKGNSPAALTAGILLLSKARSFGMPWARVEIVGAVSDITPVLGPAMVHSNVLASCGVGRELGQGPLVIVPGPTDQSLLVSLSREGLGGWFSVDTTGAGAHPATQAFVRLARDPRPRARGVSRNLRRFLNGCGVPSEPALLDLLFDAPVPPLTRLALTLRAGRAITGERGEPWHRFVVPDRSMAPDPADLPGPELLERHASGDLEPWLSRLRVGSRDQVDEWLTDMAALAAEDQGRDLELVRALGELLSHVLVLPPHSMLPPPSGAEDLVATSLGRALGASVGEHDASKTLVDIFKFLGGRFVDYAEHPICIWDHPAPTSRIERWKWFVDSASRAAAEADSLWRKVVDQPS